MARPVRSESEQVDLEAAPPALRRVRLARAGRPRGQHQAGGKPRRLAAPSASPSLSATPHLLDLLRELYYSRVEQANSHF